ncbi:MAG: dihydrolipoamide acetyltransferase family protein [Acidobacteriota bacterium]
MPTDVIMPQMGESIFEGTVTRWLKKVGDPVARDEPLFEISTDKVDSEIPAPASGTLIEIKVQEGETVQVNTVVAIIDGEGSETTPGQPPSGTHQSSDVVSAVTPVSGKPKIEEPPVAGEDKIRSSPLVRRIAREERVDLSTLEGSGVGGRITKKDILEYLSQRDRVPPVPSGAPLPGDTGISARIDIGSQDEVTPMSAMRKSIAEHMVTSRRTSAHATTVFEVDMTKIVTLKAQQSAEFMAKEGLKLSYTPFFIKVTAEALKQFPVVNASIESSNIVYRRNINIGVAVALDWGLIVPVIKNADEKSFLGLARATSDLAQRARQKKLTPEDVQHGTFTITNPGVFGSLLGAPIINQPQVAILCVGAITKRPVVINDAIAIRSMAYLTLTFDHRLIDGAVADQFLASIKGKLEQWDEQLI